MLPMKRALLAALAAVIVTCKSAPPVNPRAQEHNDVGVRYLNEGQLEKAEIRFQMALEQRPDYPEPFNNLCLIEIKRNHIDKAKGYCIKALHLNQDFAEAHNNLGFIYLQENNNTRARDEFQAAVHINPDYVAARYNLTLVLRRLKNNDEARVELIKLAESHPELADPHHDICGMDIEEGDLKEAIAECQQAIRLDNRYTAAYDQLGVAFFKSGKFCESAQAFRDCLGIEADNVECRQNLPEANKRCALLDPSIKTPVDQPPNAEGALALYRLGMDQLAKGLSGDAERTFRRCVKAEPPVADCYCQLGKMSRDDARPDDEAKFCKRCVKLSATDHQTEEKRACEKLLGAQGDF
jgi:tetratricopeptide (TPR) repeat protein